jgi:hypothetical protein
VSSSAFLNSCMLRLNDFVGGCWLESRAAVFACCLLLK